MVGLTHIFVEFPRSFWNARIQDPVFKWARFMERLWGRAMTLFLFSILMMSDTGNALKIVLGVPAFLASFVNLIIRYFFIKFVMMRNKLLNNQVKINARIPKFQFFLLCVGHHENTEIRGPSLPDFHNSFINLTYLKN